DVCATCHVHATCQQSGGKSVCICNYGFVGNGRTHCQDKDECQIGASKICGNHTLCHNTHGSFYCVCLDGYRASNNNKTFIPNDGTNCTDINECEESGLCGHNAKCVNTEGSYMCYCNDGYKLETGEHSFHRDGSIVSCKEIGCGSPPEMRHGYIVGNYSLLPGSAVHYECQEGFYSNEGKFSYCTANETWEPATLSCKGVDCGVPPSILNAHPTSVSGTTYRSEVTYNCIHGYLMAGSSRTAVCNAKGQWEGPDLVCKEEELLSNLSIFNETCVRWQRKTGKLEVQEMYTFHILGQRLDEKIFSEDVIFNISTSENNPKVCLDLNSGSNYVVNITTISSTNITVSVTVVIQTKGLVQNFGPWYSACWFPFFALKYDSLCVGEFPVAWLCDTNLSGMSITDNAPIFTSDKQGSGSYQLLYRSHGLTVYFCNILVIETLGLPSDLLILNKLISFSIVSTVKEAFNNVLIFNDTCLKWRRNVRGTDVEDRYSFHVQGQRWYQKNFFHEITFELSTHKQAPEVCLDLQPGTNYSINISMVALNFSLLVSMTTQIADPPFPEVEFVSAKGSAPLLRLRKVEDQNGPISLYQVIVLPLDLQSTFICDSFAATTFFSNTTDIKGYVAAEFQAKDVADNMSITLGDRHYYGKFYNAPLKLGEEYCVFLKIISEWNKVRTQSCAVWAQIKNLSPTMQYMTAVGLGSVAAICLILFLTFSVA
ncbi:SUSD1 protein, partial [Erythrocercus mccallii]|nr:SUSD1 protein [Erythrocercus mccallii]